MAVGKVRAGMNRASALLGASCCVTGYFSQDRRTTCDSKPPSDKRIDKSGAPGLISHPPACRLTARQAARVCPEGPRGALRATGTSPSPKFLRGAYRVAHV